MLTEADQRIVSRDGKLPGLAVLLDTERLLAELKTLEPFRNAIQAEIQYLRYKPNNSCACTLYIKSDDGTCLHYYAKALTAERFQESWNNPSRQKLVEKGGTFAPLAFTICASCCCTRYMTAQSANQAGWQMKPPSAIF